MARKNLFELKVVSLNRVYGPVDLGSLVRLAAQGRLSPRDMVRAVGVREWTPLAEVPQIAGALPQRRVSEEEFGLDDEAEGELVRWRRRSRQESELDMTPMIDVTFQLLIFFMLTNALANPPPVDVPRAEHGVGVTVERQQIILVGADGLYHLVDPAQGESATPSLPSFIDMVRGKVQGKDSPVDVIVNAHKQAQHVKVKELIQELGRLPGLGKIMVGVEESMH